MDYTFWNLRKEIHLNSLKIKEYGSVASVTFRSVFRQKQEPLKKYSFEYQTIYFTCYY